MVPLFLFLQFLYHVGGAGILMKINHQRIYISGGSSQAHGQLICNFWLPQEKLTLLICFNEYWYAIHIPSAFLQILSPQANPPKEIICLVRFPQAWSLVMLDNFCAKKQNVFLVYYLSTVFSCKWQTEVVSDTIRATLGYVSLAESFSAIY